MSNNNMLKIIEPNKKISIEDINNFEKEFKIKIPDDYKEFLLEHNGGEPEDDMIFDYDDELFGGFSILSFRSLKSIRNELKRYTENPKEDYLETIKNKLFTFCLTTFNFQLCMGFGKKNKGKIYILDREEIYNTPFILISNSFTEFMSSFVKQE
jgi:hypothetical protein